MDDVFLAADAERPLSSDAGLQSMTVALKPSHADPRISFAAELDELFRSRRDVRRFRRDPVDDGLVREIIETVRYAPSVGLSEPTRLVRLSSDEARAVVLANFERANAEALSGYGGEQAQLYATLKLAGLKEAPVQFAVFCDAGTSKGAGLGCRTMPDTLAYSSVCAVMSMWLAATARGLGLGWVSILDPEDLISALDVAPDWLLIGCVCIGWPEEYHLDPELERAGWEVRDPDGPTVLIR